MSTVSNSTLGSRFRAILGSQATSSVNRPVDAKPESVKIVMIGNSGVGKSVFMARFCGIDRNDHSFHSTIGIDYRIKTIDVLGKQKKLQIWDIVGPDEQDGFRKINCATYRRAHIAILFYEVGDRPSFINLRNYIDSISMYASDGIKMILIGKCANPQNRIVTPEEGKAFADEYGIPFLECAEDFDDSFSDSLHKVLFKKEFDEPLIARGAAIVDALTSDRRHVISHWFKKDEVTVHPPMMIRDLAKIVAAYDEESIV